MNAISPDSTAPSATTRLSGFDPAFAVTFFTSHAASTKHEERFTMASLGDRINACTASTKGQLPWLKLATFGNAPTDRGSLRHDANVLMITGIEADYDAEQMPMDAAVEVATMGGLRCIIYTSPSHSVEKPRWRVLCPFSEALLPDRRDAMMGRLNGLYKGIFARESWTLSQSYYYGSVNHNPAHRVEVIEGESIDELHKLDRIATGKPNGLSMPNSSNSSGTAQTERASDTALLDQIRQGISYTEPTKSLAGRWALQDVLKADAFAAIVAAMEAVPAEAQDARWKDRRRDAGRVVSNIYRAEDRKRAKQAGAEPTNIVPLMTKLLSPVIIMPDNDASVDAEADAALEAQAEPTNVASLRVVSSQEKPGSKRSARAPDFGLTEDGIALTFTARHGEQLRFCHDSGSWYVWKGAVWRQERTKLAFSWARQTCRDLARRASERDQFKITKAAFAAAVERFAQADRVHAVTSETWDRDTWLLGTPGGTVDLKTIRVRPAQQCDFITKQTAVAPAATPDCPLWLDFLDQATAGDDGLIRFLRQWCGYCLTGDTREHALLFGFGPGGNGKSVFLNTVAGVMGDYARIAAMETFTASQGDKHPTDLAMLRGARLVCANETEEGRAWAEVRIKQLTGGDTITARFMRQDFFEFRPQFKLVVIGNHKPVLKNVDDAAKRRFNVVPFLHKPASPDRELETKLKAEWPGILRWMMEGCLDWQTHGLVRPTVVKDATAEYFSEQDVLAQWVEDQCEVGVGVYDTAASLFSSWQHYAQACGEAPGTAKRFSMAMQRLGFRPTQNTPGRHSQRGFAGARVRVCLSQ